MEENVPRDQLFLVLILAFSLLVLLREKSDVARKHFSLAMACLVFFGFAGHFNFFGWHPGKIYLHNLDVYHYFMGTKYFPEVGYTRLYDASLIADSEDDPYFTPAFSLRSLDTYQFVPRKTVLDRKAEIVGRFSPERWAEFRSDLAVFRATAPTNWGRSFSYLDHGYNGSPLITEILGDLAAQRFLSTADFIQVAARLDIALILLAALIMARLLSSEAALTFLFFTAVNPFNDYSMLGGAYLRYLSFVTLGLSIACYRAGRPAASGVLVAISGLMRVFPFLCVAALMVSHALRKDRWQAIMEARRFYAAFFAACLCGLILTSRTPDPISGNPWLAFEKQISLHSGALTLNRVGLKTMFQFSDAKNFDRLSAELPGQAIGAWYRETQATYAARKPYYVLSFVLLGVAVLPFLHEARQAQPFFGGLVLSFGALILSQYYYLFLALVPLMFNEERRVSLATIWAFATMIALAAFSPLGQPYDRRFFCMSLCIAVLFAAALFMKGRARASEANALPPLV